MKYRESGMPSEEMWDAFFIPNEVIDKIGIDKQIETLIDVGCGYGTFLIPMAERINGKIIGVDIDTEMIEICREKIVNSDCTNIELVHGDISTETTLKDLEKYIGKVEYITLFNILHCEEPTVLLTNIYSILNDHGRIGITHWKHEKTPRGPSMEIRPKPEMIIKWAENAGFTIERQVELPPYHYGLVFIKKRMEE